MKRKRMIWVGFIALLVAALIPTCTLKDLRSAAFKTEGISSIRIAKGNLILAECLKAQGLDSFARHATYEIEARDRWSKMLGINPGPWPGENGPWMRFRYATGTFDSDATWLEGSLQRQRYGIQSWQVYRAKGDGAVEKIKNKKMAFALPTMQYFMELPARLATAPIIAFLEERTFNGQMYDVLFCTWGSPEPDSRYDQYLLYINRASKLCEMTTYTIRDNYLPAPRSFYGTAKYWDFRDVNGAKVPFRMDVQAGDPSLEEKYVHRFEIRTFRFDAFASEVLYPIPGLQRMGDTKQE